MQVMHILFRHSEVPHPNTSLEIYGSSMKRSALDVRQKCIDDTERDLKDRITGLKRQERNLHVLKEDHLSAVKR